MVFSQVWYGIANRLFHERSFKPSPDCQPRKKITIALLSFNRPRYLSKVLASLIPQLQPEDEVFLFQDGSFNSASKLKKTDDKQIDQCVKIFEYLIARRCNVKVFRSSENLGIAGNYRVAEKYVFETLDRNQALFLEDDLVLGPDFLHVTDKLLDLSEKEPMIGYVSAYGDLWASRRQQHERNGQLILMHENWGAALTKRSWLAQQEVREQYWSLIENVDYRFRDNERIISFYRDLGFKCRITSQDSARWIACLKAGMVRLTTSTCNARYIGKIGEHSRASYFRKYHFNDSEIFDGITVIEIPDKSELERWYEKSLEDFKCGYVHSYQKKLNLVEQG
ncbi:MAG: glycosyltransferase [Chlorobiaceae bacterium]|nr:glycosyltransferase [Chlorobiaceae bacterium]